MGPDQNQSAGVGAPPSRLPMVLVVALVLAVIGGVSWWLLGRTAAEPAASTSTVNATAAAPATPDRSQLLPSGLRIETIREGNGPLITRADAVLVRYEMRVAGGPVIDSNMDGPQGLAMTLDGVIPGIAEGLTHMRPGGIARLWVPPQLGYGDIMPTGATFDRNATLEFLIRIEQVAVGRAAEMEAARAGNEVQANGTQANTAGTVAPRGRTGTGR